MQFRKFKEVCKEAFLIVRSHANLFINLLNMMLSTGLCGGWGAVFCFMCECCAYPHPAPPGIPELQSHEDVDYLRQTLFLDMTEEQAAVAFMEEVCLVWGERMGKDDLTDSPACTLPAD